MQVYSDPRNVVRYRAGPATRGKPGTLKAAHRNHGYQQTVWQLRGIWRRPVITFCLRAGIHAIRLKVPAARGWREQQARPASMRGAICTSTPGGVSLVTLQGQR